MEELKEHEESRKAVLLKEQNKAPGAGTKEMET